MNKLLGRLRPSQGTPPLSLPPVIPPQGSKDPSGPGSGSEGQGRGGQRWATFPDQLAQAVLRQRALLPGIGCAQLLCPPATHSLDTTARQLKPAQRDAFHPPGKHYFSGSRRKQR